MSEVSDRRRRQIIEKYAGLGGDEVDLILKERDSQLIVQLVNALTQKVELEEIEASDLKEVASIVAEYFPLMSFQPMRYAEFLEENLV